MKYVIIGLSLLLISPAIAAEEFVPYQIDQNTYQAIVTYLGDVPSKWANPILSELARLEAKAVSDKKAATVKPPEAPPDAKK